jgi:hypothetical protein
MAANRSTFDKMQRDRAKKARAAAKRERRQGGKAAADAETETETPEAPPLTTDGELTAAELLYRVEDLHRRREAGIVGLEEFELEKAELMARLPID